MHLRGIEPEPRQLEARAGLRLEGEAVAAVVRVVLDGRVVVVAQLLEIALEGGEGDLQLAQEIVDLRWKNYEEMAGFGASSFQPVY